MNRQKRQVSYNLLSASLEYMHHCMCSAQVCGQLADNIQPLMGCSPRSDYHRLLSRPCSDGSRAGASNRALHLFDRPEHHSILIRRCHWFPVPLFLDSKRPEGPFYLPNQTDSLPLDPRQHFLLACLAIWLRQSRSHRLPDFHPREILQASPGHVPPPDHLPEEISFIQIRRCPHGHPRCRNLHASPPGNKQEDRRVRQSAIRLVSIRDLPPRDQPPP